MKTYKVSLDKIKRAKQYDKAYELIKIIISTVSKCYVREATVDVYNGIMQHPLDVLSMREVILLFTCLAYGAIRSRYDDILRGDTA